MIDTKGERVYNEGANIYAAKQTIRSSQRLFVAYNSYPPSYTDRWYLGPLYGQPLTSELLGRSLDTTCLCFYLQEL